MYDETYYNSINYTNYLTRKHKYRQLAIETTEFLRKLKRLDGTILDYGCATGFLLDSLIDLGHTAWGYDISEWAVSQAKQKGLPAYTSINYHMDVSPPKVTYILDVLEHIDENDLDCVLDEISTSETIVFRIPVCIEEGESFFLEVSRRDPTHITCWTKEKWKTFFSMHGYKTIELDLHTIYDTPGVFCGIGVKV
jgi:SAM-dependent methyltransferase